MVCDAQPLSKSRIALCIYGVFAGGIFSLLMDVWTVIWMSGDSSYDGYFTAVTYALYFTAIYALSNTVFLLLLNKPIGGTLKRLKTKYGIEV